MRKPDRFLLFMRLRMPKKECGSSLDADEFLPFANPAFITQGFRPLPYLKAISNQLKFKRFTLSAPCGILHI